jgi:Zn-dependent protease with chaperone function
MSQFPSNALCFGQDLPASGRPCHVTVTSSGLVLAFADIPPETIPFATLSVKAGGFDHDQLVLTWSVPGGDRTLYLPDPEAIRAFRRAASPELLAHVERTAKQVRRARHGRRTILLAAIGSVLGLMLVLWLASDRLVQMAVSRIPVEWEKPIGAAARAEFLTSQAVIKDGPAVTVVQEITRRLTEALPNNPYRFDVTVVRSDTVNAFALPGGYVVVFTGLLKKAESPEEVAGVLAHELNHVVLRHGLERMVKTAGIMAIVTVFVGDQQGLIGLAKKLGIELITLRFGRDQETQADLNGLRLLNRAKISSEGMIRFFERLSEADTLQVELLSTHPMSATRAERLKAETAALPYQEPVPFSFDWGAVQAGL